MIVCEADTPRYQASPMAERSEPEGCVSRQIKKNAKRSEATKRETRLQVFVYRAERGLVELARLLRIRRNEERSSEASAMIRKRNDARDEAPSNRLPNAVRLGRAGETTKITPE